MKLISWNVNGLRACIQKGFLDYFHEQNADFVCLQETKLSEGQLNLDLPGYEQYWCYAQKKGYSGTAIFTKHTPLSVHYGLDVPELDTEGRLITLEYPEFFLVTCYTPNAQRELARIDHRMKWDEAFRTYLQKLDAQKPVIICGDLNVAHQEIDLKNPKSNRGSAGFSDEERNSFQQTLDCGFTDTFRHLHPDETDCYTWWSYMFKAREKNVGWRIDYFLVSNRVNNTVYYADIHKDVLGSDHCPVSIDMDLTCNGGIWNPDPEGIPQVLRPDGTSATEPKASAPKAKAFAAGALVLVSLILLLALLPNENSDIPFPVVTMPATSTPTSNQPPIMVFTPTWDIGILSSSQTPTDYTSFFLTAPQGDNILAKYHIDPLPSELTVQYPVHLCFSLTDFGKEQGLDKVPLQLTFDPLTYASSIAEGNTFDYTEFTPVDMVEKLLIPYYTDESLKDIAGWLFLGTTSQSADFEVNMYWYFSPNIRHEHTEPVHVDVLPKTLPAATVLVITEFYTPLEVTKHSPAGTEISYGKYKWYTDSFDASSSLARSTFWLYVGINYASIPVDEAFLQIDVGDEDHFSSVAPDIITLRCYSDASHSVPTGWLVYGSQRLHQLSALNITVKRPNSPVTVVPLAYYPSHYLREGEAKLLTTQRLIELIMSNQGIYESLTYPYDTTEGNVIAAAKNYPAIAELLTRADAVKTLMNYPIDRDSPRAFIPSVLLSHPTLQKQMNFQQRADYITGYYTSSIEPFAFLQKLEIGKKYSIESLIEILLQDPRPGQWIDQCSTEEEKQIVWHRILQHSQALQQLLSYGDTALSHIAARLSEQDSLYLRALFNDWYALQEYTLPQPDIEFPDEPIVPE